MQTVYRVKVRGGRIPCKRCARPFSRPSASRAPQRAPTGAAAWGTACTRWTRRTAPATDADEDAVTGLIYLAELTDERASRIYALKSIAAFVLDDLGLADPARNSRRVPLVGDIPAALRTIWLWRGGSCWGGYDTAVNEGARSDNRNLCLAPAYFSPGQWRLFAKVC